MKCIICGKEIGPPYKNYHMVSKMTEHGGSISSEPCIYKEDKLMEDIKVIYKEPMTEETKRQKFIHLIADYDARRIKLSDYADKAMDICRNEPKEVKGIEIKGNANGIYGKNGITICPLPDVICISKEQIEAAYNLLHKDK